MKNKRGISPVIATVLLVVIAVILFLIIFLWLRGFMREAVTKNGVAIETVCTTLKFSLAYSEGKLQINNLGDVPIYRAEIFVVNATKTAKVTAISNIVPASTLTVDVSCAGNKIKVIPVLLGETKAGAQREHVCENKAKTILC